jgi:acyl-[acyl carrier protein]--UDP-N-acetylglucosamine O-acyltransferase
VNRQMSWAWPSHVALLKEFYRYLFRNQDGPRSLQERIKTVPGHLRGLPTIESIIKFIETRGKLPIMPARRPSNAASQREQPSPAASE